MQKVIIDSCGWVALVEAGLNLDSEMSVLTGPFRMMLLPSVNAELEKLSEHRKSLLLDLLRSRSDDVEPTVDSGSHTDDQIHDLAQNNGWAVLTVDRVLKKRLIESSCMVIEVVSGKRLRIAVQ